MAITLKDYKHEQVEVECPEVYEGKVNFPRFKALPIKLVEKFQNEETALSAIVQIIEKHVEKEDAEALLSLPTEQITKVLQAWTEANNIPAPKSEK